MAEKSKHGNLLDDIIQFIEAERELYGDFDVPEVVEADQLEPVIAADNQNGDSASTDMKYFDSQEKIFEDADHPHREIYQKIGNCDTLDELKILCKQAEDVLQTDLNNTTLVFGKGHPHADLMLIGEAPGAQEDKQGEPFVGRAGKLLTKILSAINFSRDEVYITNILKHRPPNNRNPKSDERQRSLPFLLRQIDLIDPKIILCLGKVSAQTLLENDDTLGSMRGRFHSFRGKYELMATYHPAALLRHPAWKRPTWEDMQLLRKHYDEVGGEP